jgi:hypothetical protein
MDSLLTGSMSEIDSKLMEPELNWLEMNLSDIDDLKKSLYENFVSRVIDITDYRELKSNYEAKVEKYKQRYLEIMSMITERRIENMKMRELTAILEKFLKSLKLTGELVDKFVCRIEVFRDGMVYVEFNV